MGLVSLWVSLMQITFIGRLLCGTRDGRARRKTTVWWRWRARNFTGEERKWSRVVGGSKTVEGRGKRRGIFARCRKLDVEGFIFMPSMEKYTRERRGQICTAGLVQGISGA